MQAKCRHIAFAIIAIALFHFNAFGQADKALFGISQAVAFLPAQPIELKITLADSAVIPGSKIRITYNVKNHSLDTVPYRVQLSSPENLNFIYSNEEKLMLPKQEASFTVLVVTDPLQAPGDVLAKCVLHGSGHKELAHQDYSFAISQLSKIKAYAAELPRNAAKGESDTAVFAVRNLGNVEEILDIYLLGMDKRLKDTIVPGEEKNYEIVYSVPKDHYKESYQVGVVIDRTNSREQLSNIRPIPVYASVLKPDKSSNKSRIRWTQEEGVSNNGFNPVYRSRSYLQMTLGQDSRKQLKVDGVNSTVRSSGYILTVPRLMVKQGFGTRAHHFQLGAGTMNVEAPFYLRLPRNFIGGNLAYNNEYLKSESRILNGYTLSASDTVQQVGIQNAAIGTEKFRLLTKNTVFLSQGQAYGLSRNFVEIRPSKLMQLELGTHFYNTVSLESMAIEGNLAAGNNNTSLSGSFLKTPRNFTPGNGLITMGQGSLNTKIKEHSFSVSASGFQQGDELSERTISRYSIGTFNNLRPTKNLSIYGAFMIFENLNTSSLGSYSLLSRNTNVRLTRNLNGGSSLSIAYKNQFTDQKINSILNRHEYSIANETRRGQAMHILEASYEHSSFIDRTRLSYQTYIPITRRISLAGQGSFNYQPSLRIDRYVTASGELRYAKDRQELGIKMTTALNNNAPDLWGITVRGSLELAVPRRSDRKLKTLELTIVDDLGAPVSNALVTINKNNLISNKEGKIRVETLIQDSVDVTFDTRSLPFGSKPKNNLQQTIALPTKTTTTPIELTYTTRIRGSAEIRRNSDFGNLVPRYSSYVVRLTQGEKTILRNLKPNGTFEAASLESGTWQVELILKDKDYKIFTVPNSVQTKELAAGELWNISFIFQENGQKVKFQRGIGK